MKKARAAQAQLRSLTRMYGVVPASFRTVQIACIQVIMLYGSELWWDLKKGSQRDDL
jgi:hypothetical protein